MSMNELNLTIESTGDEQMSDPDGEPPEPGLQVSIANEQSQYAIDEARLRDAVTAAFDGTPYQTGFVSIAVVDDPTIHAINRQYLDHDYPTDVLSFVLEDREPYLEGELVVSTDTAARNAEEYGWTAEDELLLYVIHGALHLVGYRDKRPEEAAKMYAAEMRVLQHLGITMPKDSARWSQTPPESTHEAPSP